MTVNKVILVGNVGRDPEVRRTQNANPMATFSLATTERWRDRNSGEQREQTEWHRVVVWGRTAEVVENYVRKGSRLYVEGKLRTRKYQAQDGSERYTTEVNVSVDGTVQMLDKRGERGDAPPAPSGSDYPAEARRDGGNHGGGYGNNSSYSGGNNYGQGGGQSGNYPSNSASNSGYQNNASSPAPAPQTSNAPQPAPSAPAKDLPLVDDSIPF